MPATDSLDRLDGSASKTPRDKIAWIAAQAQFIFERSIPHQAFDTHGVDYQATTDDSSSDHEKLIDNRLARWCFVVAQGNHNLFEKRLRWDGIDNDTARSLLRSQEPSSEPLSGWATTLQAIVEMAKSNADDVCDEYDIPWRDSAQPLPFEEVWLPAIRVARQRLFDRVRWRSHSNVSIFAYLGIELGLRRRLTNLGARTLSSLFAKSQPMGANLLNSLVSEDLNLTTDRYRVFVESMLEDGLIGLFQSYPVLARFVATLVDDSVEANVEFLRRLESDRTAIESLWGADRELGPVIAVQSLLSDVHHGGRSVMAITFESGRRLVYKPRDLAIEVALGEFQEWCDEKCSRLAFQPLNILPRNGYGWVEYVEQRPCNSPAEAQRFYERSGRLLGLLYALEGTDCHSENVIACGEHLRIVDAEALMHPRAHSMAKSVASRGDETSFNIYDDSVMRVGLLPHWNVDAYSETPYDMSGLGGNENQQSSLSRLRWKSINTDQMRLIHERVVPRVEANVPALDGRSLSAADYIENIVVGFGEMYRMLMSHRQDLISTSSVLTRFRCLQSRFIFRRTQVYGSVLFNGLSPNALRDGMDFSIEIDALSRAFLFSDEKPDAWPILRAEHASLERLDFPYFAAIVSADGLFDSLGTSLEHYFERSGYDQVLQRLNQFSEHDLARQISLIRGSLYASSVRIERPAHGSKSEMSSKEVSDEPCEVPPERLLEAAQTIAATIHRNAIQASDGSVDWIGLSRIPRTERFQYQPMGFNLYDGKSGIALFLAAFDAERKSDQYRDLILGALQPLRQEFSQDSQGLRKWVRLNEHGGACGVGSILYTWVNLSKHLSEPSLLDEARQVVSCMPEDWIAGDRRLDVVSGAAGTLLGILSLYRATQDRALLTVAIACGQHVLDQRVSVDGAPQAWVTLDRKPLTGFSHGAAGIAYALLQLYAATNDVAFRNAAFDAIAYESTAFSKSESNWIDYRGHEVRRGEHAYAMSWCHGAPGIVLARLGGRALLSAPEKDCEVDLALAKMQTTPFQEVDFPCCGNMGLADILMVASNVLDRPALRAAANRRVMRTLDNARKTGCYQLAHRVQTNDFHLGFFQGIAGIGYTFLRCLNEQKFPCIILWE